MTIAEPIVWRIISKSVRGDTHERSGRPNQDAFTLFPLSAAGRDVAVAVADGHGSAKSFRSALGARFAVESSAALAESLLEENPPDMALSAVKRLAEDEVPKRLTRDWRKRVGEHVQQHPFTPEELEDLEVRGMSAHAEVEADPALAYGSTVLTVVATERYMLFWQLGDGDIVIVMPDGQAARPLPKDELLLGNETTSLCSSRAWRFVRVGFHALFGPVPALVLVSTDGLANSFADDAGFLQFGTDILRLIEAAGPGAIEGDLEEWLTQITQRASGDDITLAIITEDRAGSAARPGSTAVSEGSVRGEQAAAASTGPTDGGERGQCLGDPGAEPTDERGG